MNPKTRTPGLASWTKKKMNKPQTLKQNTNKTLNSQKQKKNQEMKLTFGNIVGFFRILHLIHIIFRQALI